MVLGDNIIEFPTVRTDFRGSVIRNGNGLKPFRTEKGLGLNKLSVVPVSDIYSKINRMIEPGYGMMDFNEASYISQFNAPIIPLSSGEALYSEDDEVYLIGSNYCNQITINGIEPMILEKTEKGSRLVLKWKRLLWLVRCVLLKKEL